MISIWVPGIPKPGGSKTPGVAKSGKIYLRPACKGVKAWMETVALSAMMQHGTLPPLPGPLIASLRFHMPRPKSHFRANGRELSKKAPLHHTYKPDFTKLVRATEDALKGILWEDDSQIIEQGGGKQWASGSFRFQQPGVSIGVRKFAVREDEMT